MPQLETWYRVSTHMSPKSIRSIELGHKCTRTRYLVLSCYAYEPQRYQVSGWPPHVAQLTKDKPFSYGRMLRLDCEDPESENLVLLAECSKGVRKMWVLKNLLVKESCGPESFRLEIAFTNNLITTLHPYIQGHVSLKERSPSPKKVAPKKPSVHSRPAKKKKTKLLESESESSSSTNDEEMRTTPGA